MNLNSTKSLLRNHLPTLTALAGFFVFAYCLFSGYQNVPLMYDEFQYLYRGTAFITGTYFPYQSFGFYMNKLPLAYYAYGIVQALFGYGLRSGRLFSIVCALMAVLAYWSISRRFSGGWAGAIMVWAFTLNNTLLNIYSQSLSQAFTACLLGWTLFFLFQKSATTRSIFFSSILASAAILTRVNMFPLLFLVVLFYAWTAGKKTALTALAVSSSLLIAVHIIFFPGILQIWLDPLPEFLKSILPIYERISGLPAWNPQISLLPRLHSFWSSIRTYFFSLAGTFLGWMLWKRKNKEWTFQDKTSFALGAFLVVMLLLHSWQTLSKNYCVYCLITYYSFWFGAGVLFVLMTARSWQRTNKTTALVVSMLWLLLAAGIGFSWTADLGNSILNWQVPRIKGLVILPGTTQLQTLLGNKFGLSYDELKFLLPTLIGLAVGMLVLALSAIAWKFLRRSRPDITFSRVMAISGLTLAFVFTSSLPLSGGNFAGSTDCNVLEPLEKASAHISQILPENALIYWGSSNAPYFLASLPKYRIFPQQLESVYSQRIGGNTNELLRQGYWNEEAANDWLLQADAVMLYQIDFNGELVKAISPDNWNALPAIEVNVCGDTSKSLFVFVRK